MDVIQATQELERMNLAEELDRMIAEMQMRTGSSPAQVICSQNTLNRLWEESGMIYSSESDIENGTGYVARYMGTPIMVSPEIDDEKLYLLPEQRADRPIQYRWFSDDTLPTESRDDYWWLRSPLNYDSGFTHVECEQAAQNIEDVTKKMQKGKAKKPANEQVCIDEDSFLNILKGDGKAT